jgi:alcohol dehydrogenase class IV
MKRSIEFFNFGKPVEDWHGKFTPSTISVMCVPTTLSGGEFNRGGGGTNDLDMHKQLGTDPSSPGPKVIIWDPELVMTTPIRVWLSTGMRAVDHIVESYCSQASKPEAKENAFLGLKLLVPGLIRTKRNPDDLEARLDAQKGGRYSMTFLRMGIPVGGSHGIGHQLGPYGVPHGETTCVMLPFVLKYNAKVNRGKQQEMLAVLWESEIVAEVLRKWRVKEDGSAELADAIDAIVRELGLPRSLREVGVGRDKWDVIAESSIKDKCCTVNPIPLTKKEQVIEILEMAA